MTENEIAATVVVEPGSAQPMATFDMPLAPDVPPPTKRVRSVEGVAPQAPQRSYLHRIPLEILAEILSYAPSPQSVLALARCSTYFCSTLVNNPASTFIWRLARKRYQPDPIPDPTPNFTEASYAAFLFDAGECQYCKKKTKAIYQSFGLRARFCEGDKKHCYSKWRISALMGLDSTVPPRYKDIILWIPRLEKTAPPGLGWDICVRKTDWTKAVNEFNKAMLSPSTADAYIREKQALADRLPAIMELASKLLTWRESRVRCANEMKRRNDIQARTHAAREGWKQYDLLQTKSYGSLYRSRLTTLEPLTEQDFAAIQADVEREIVQIRERRERRTSEQAYKQRRDDVEKYYNRLKSERGRQVLPTLLEFRKLSIMKIMQNKSSDEVAGISKELKDSILVDELLKENLDKWRQDARAALAGVLGFKGWKAATKRKLHPVDRLTARFACKKCHIVGKKQQEQNSLDFAGACEHRCPNLNKRQRAKEEWSTDQFEPDVQVIEAAKQILTLCGTSAEDPASLGVVQEMGSRIVCLSCPLPMPMNFGCAIRHCKRHDDAKFSLIETDDAVLLSYANNPIEPGLTARLMVASDDAEKQRSLKIYGCRYCQLAYQTQQVVNAPEQGNNDVQAVRKANKLIANSTKLLNFNGLRSHAKEKHGIIHLGDEDFYRQKEDAAAKQGESR